METSNCMVCGTNVATTVAELEVAKPPDQLSTNQEPTVSETKLREILLCHECIRRERKRAAFSALLIAVVVSTLVFGLMYWDNGGETLRRMMTEREGGPAGGVIDAVQIFGGSLILLIYHAWYIAVPLFFVFVFWGANRRIILDLSIRVLGNEKEKWDTVSVLRVTSIND